jgi:carbon storage regulator CsrA
MTWDDPMDKPTVTVAQQIARAAITLQGQRTGHVPKAVTVILTEDTLVVTLHDALSPAEKALATTPAGAAQVQGYHRQLFSSSSESLVWRSARQPRKSRRRPGPWYMPSRKALWCRCSCWPTGYLRVPGAVMDREITHENGGSAMLVLSRKQMESVVVGGPNSLERMLTVTVLEIDDGRVRLGFEVNEDVPVHRQEVWERIRANGRPSVSSEDRVV